MNKFKHLNCQVIQLFLLYTHFCVKRGYCWGSTFCRSCKNRDGPTKLIFSKCNGIEALKKDMCLVWIELHGGDFMYHRQIICIVYYVYYGIIRLKLIHEHSKNVTKIVYTRHMTHLKESRNVLSGKHACNSALHRGAFHASPISLTMRSTPTRTCSRDCKGKIICQQD